MDGPNATLDGIPLTRTVPHKGATAVVISYDAIVRAVGRPARSGYGHNLLLACWDSIGLTVLCDGDRPRDGELLNFALTLRSGYHTRPMDPKGQFTGSLRVDGIEITSATRLADIVPALVEKGFKPCQGTSCYRRESDHYGLTVAAEKDGLVFLLIFDVKDLVGVPKPRR